MKGCFSSLHCLPQTCYSQGQMGGGGKRRPGKGGVVSAASMRALKPTSAFRTGTRRSRRRLENQTLSSRMSAEPSPALSSLFNGQNPHQSLCQAPAPARRPALDQGESPDGPGGPGTGSVPRPRRPPGMPRPLPASTGSPRNPNLDEVSSPAQSELVRCAPSPWCAASRALDAQPPASRPAVRGARTPSPRVAAAAGAGAARTQTKPGGSARWRRWLTLAAAAAGSSATYPAGARSGGAETAQMEPEPEPEPGRSGAGSRSLRAPAASSAAAPRCAARRPRGRGRAGGSTLLRAPPAPPPSSCLHPGYLSARWQLGGGEGGCGNNLPRVWHRLWAREF